MTRGRIILLAGALVLGASAMASGQSTATDRVSSLQKAFTHQIEREPGESSSATVLFAIVAGAIGAWIVVYGVMQWRQGADAVQSLPRISHRFFNHVLGDMGLNRSDRSLLRRAAQVLGMSQPCVMLMDPNLFERFAGQYADSLPSRSMQQRARQRLETIAAVAFPPDPSAPRPTAQPAPSGPPRC